MLWFGGLIFRLGGTIDERNFDFYIRGELRADDGLGLRLDFGQEFVLRY